MEIKYLAKAIRFATLPTISVLILIFFGFFSVDKTLSFITSDNGWAIILRVALVIIEIGLIVVMYLYYRREDILSNPANNKRANMEMNAENYIRNLKRNWDSRDRYVAHYTDSENLVIVERIPKSNL